MNLRSLSYICSQYFAAVTAAGLLEQVSMSFSHLEGKFCAGCLRLLSSMQQDRPVFSFLLVPISPDPLLYAHLREESPQHNAATNMPHGEVMCSVSFPPCTSFCMQGKRV
ncbi:hypothetical protein GOODEAATRI_005093 [Goodea atripinnis]|uniref:Secreted protein n=1 Tax=Goodea atripinnis TaxID=208336 RepID=A0ABV0NRZ7_9TELE